MGNAIGTTIALACGGQHLGHHLPVMNGAVRLLPPDEEEARQGDDVEQARPPSEMPHSRFPESPKPPKGVAAQMTHTSAEGARRTCACNATKCTATFSVLSLCGGYRSISTRRVFFGPALVFLLLALVLLASSMATDRPRPRGDGVAEAEFAQRHLDAAGGALLVPTRGNLEGAMREAVAAAQLGGETETAPIPVHLPSLVCELRCPAGSRLAPRDVAPTHDVYKLSERLVMAIEKPGGAVHESHVADFEADFAAEL